MKASTRVRYGSYCLIRKPKETLFTRNFLVLLTVLSMTSRAACGRPLPQQKEFQIDGQVIALMEYGGQGDSGLQMSNSNYLIADGIAYYLHFSEYDCQVIGMNRPQGEVGLQIPAPEKLGPVMIYKHSIYRVRGQIFEPPSSGASVPAQFISKEELARRIEARMNEPGFADLDARQKALVVTESDRMIRKASQIPTSYEGLPTKLLRVMYFELLPHKFADSQDSNRNKPPDQESDRSQTFNIGIFRMRIPETWRRTDTGGSGPQVFTKDAKTSGEKSESISLLSFEIPGESYTCLFLVADTPLAEGGLAILRTAIGKESISLTNANYEAFIILGATKGQRTAGATAEYRTSKGNCIQLIVKAPLNTKDAALTDFIRSVLGRITCARP